MDFNNFAKVMRKAREKLSGAPEPFWNLGLDEMAKDSGFPHGLKSVTLELVDLEKNLLCQWHNESP